MQIEENKVYLFKFHTDSGELAIPVRAQSSAEAADSLQKMLGRMQTEVALDFPQVLPTMSKGIPQQGAFTTSVIPDEVLEMKLDTLFGDLGGGDLTPEAKAETIKKWTGHDLTPTNYTKIITDLELIKTGQKEVPPPLPKGKGSK